MGGGCAALAFLMERGRQNEADEQSRRRVAEANTTRDEPPPVEKLLEVDAMELEVGLSLVPLVDESRGGDLLERVTLIRRQIAAELGIIVPPVRIRDNLQIAGNDYVVKIRGMAVARGEAFCEQYLAMDSGAATGELPHAAPTTEPAFGLPAYWITEPQRAEAEVMNYTVVEATAVLATHLTEVIRRHAGELLTRQDVRGLVDALREKAPAVVEEVVPGVVKPGDLQKVLRGLLRERVPIRDLEAILETLGDVGRRTQDVEILGEYCRHALARTICKQHVDEDDTLHCVTLDPALEDLIGQHVDRGENGTTYTLPPQTQQAIIGRIAEKAAELTATGRPAVIVCSPQVRLATRRIVEDSLPQTAIIGYNEIVPEVKVEAIGLVGLAA